MILKKKIVFLTDADEKIGLGHLNRCNLLAEEFFKKNFDCYIFGVKKFFINNSFFRKKIEYSPILLKSIDLDFVKRILGTNNFFLIIDSFRVNEPIQKQLFKKKIKWLQFDNFQKNTKIYADVVVNANPLIKKKDYNKRRLKNKKQTFLTGKNFLLMRNEFKKNYKLKKKFILVCSGGSRLDKNYVIGILRIVLKIFKHQKIIVILGNNDVRRKKILKLNTNSNKIKIIKKTTKISKYFAQSKVVFLSGGTILIESLFYNLNRFVCSIASNQIHNCLSWEKLKFVNYLGDLSKKKLKKEFIIKKIQDNQNKYKNKTLNKKLINGKKLIYKNIVRLF